MAGKSYVVRHAGSRSRPGKVFKIYPYTLRSLIDAMDEARMRSFGDGPHVLTVVEDRRSTVIRRDEHGRQVYPPPGVPTRAARRQSAADRLDIPAPADPGKWICVVRGRYRPVQVWYGHVYGSEVGKRANHRK